MNVQKITAIRGQIQIVLFHHQYHEWIFPTSLLHWSQHHNHQCTKTLPGDIKLQLLSAESRITEVILHRELHVQSSSRK